MPGLLAAAHDALGETFFYYVLSPALKIAVLLVLVLTLIAYTTFAERKILGFLQVRTGPNRVGPWGLLQPLADVAKLLVKQDIIPDRAVRWAFVLAPCLVVGPALVIFSVIPFGPSAEATGAFHCSSPMSMLACCLSWRWPRSVSTGSFSGAGPPIINSP